METTKKNDEKQEATKNAKPVNGTETTSNWEKAAELIAGNNQLMSTLLKLLLSPLTLLAGAGLIIYLFYKNKTQKDELVKLKEENKKLSEEKLLISEEAEHFQRKYKKIKKVLEIDNSQSEQFSLPQEKHNVLQNINKNNLSYLR